MEDKKKLELIPLNTEKKLKKHNATIELQETIKSMTEIPEEIYRISESLFTDLTPLAPTIQAIQKMTINFSLNIQSMMPVLEKIGNIQRNFLNSVQWETFQNIAKVFNEITPEEMEALIEEANKEEKLSEKKPAKKSQQVIKNFKNDKDLILITTKRPEKSSQK